MIQQVNLYQGYLDKGQATPIINQSIFGLIAILLIVLGYSLYLVIDLKNTKHDLEIAKQQLVETNTRVQLLQIQFPEQHINKLLIDEITRSQTILSSLSEIIHLLKDETSDQTQGFSRYFSAFAQQSINDVWLRKISINAEKNSILLEGSTYKVNRIPIFLQNLHHEAVFQGRNFAHLLIAQEKETDNQINFTVNTSTDVAEQDNHE